jgi:hypothetical protein
VLRQEKQSESNGSKCSGGAVGKGPGPQGVAKADGDVVMECSPRCSDSKTNKSYVRMSLSSIWRGEEGKQEKGGGQTLHRLGVASFSACSAAAIDDGRGRRLFAARTWSTQRFVSSCRASLAQPQATDSVLLSVCWHVKEFGMSKADEGEKSKRE